MKKLVLTAALALVAVFAVASTAAAYDAAISPAGEISTTSNGGVTFEASGIEIICNLTLAGSLEGSVSSVESDTNQDLGEITSVEWNSCSGGNVRAVLGLEWNVSYDGSQGTLPNEVSAVDFTIDDAEFQLSVFGGFVNCLYTGDADVSMAVSRTRSAGVYTSSTISTTGSVYDKVSGTLCPATGSMTGSFSMSPTQTITVE